MMRGHFKPVKLDNRVGKELKLEWLFFLSSHIQTVYRLFITNWLEIDYLKEIKKKLKRNEQAERLIEINTSQQLDD